MNTIRFKVILLLLVACTSCQKVLSPLEFRNWYYQHQTDFSTSFKLYEYEFDLIEKPFQVVCLESLSRGRLDTAAYKKELSLKKTMRFFELRIKSLKSSSSSQQLFKGTDGPFATNLFPEFNFNQTRFIINTDTIMPSSVHLEAGNSIRPYHTLLISYDCSEIASPVPQDAMACKILLTGFDQAPLHQGVSIPLYPKLPSLKLDYDTQ
jgi:hypothetical protein